MPWSRTWSSVRSPSVRTVTSTGLQLPAGAVLVTREGHVFTRHSVSFHAPDSDLHGVLSRQREIEQLTANRGV